MFRLVLVGVLSLILIAILTACGSATPTPTPTATPIPTATPAPTATPVPTATPAPTATPVPTATPTPMPEPTPMEAPSQPDALVAAIQAYASAACFGGQGLPEGGTWGQLTAQLGLAVPALSAVTPPEAISDYHQALVATFSAILEVAETKPQDQVVNPMELAAPSIIAAATGMGQASAQIEPSIWEVMSAAGCAASLLGG